jgi:hypothetical protein
MWKVDQKSLDDMERQYEGIVDTIMYFENAQPPACSLCGSGFQPGRLADAHRQFQIAGLLGKVWIVRGFHTLEQSVS